VSGLPGRRDSLGFIAFLVLCLAVAALGGAATASSVGNWYPTLAKPAFNPPNWIFAPVWTALYFMMAVAGWRVWRRDGLRRARWALTLFALQLALNLAWSILFFGMHSIGAALIEIVVLLLAILATALAFWRRDRAAGMLFVPYAAWVAFAAVLNAAIWRLN
jgi:tryptophan-rich sensory protein